MILMKGLGGGGDEGNRDNGPASPDRDQTLV